MCEYRTNTNNCGFFMCENLLPDRLIVSINGCVSCTNVYSCNSTKRIIKIIKYRVEVRIWRRINV